MRVAGVFPTLLMLEILLPLAVLIVVLVFASLRRRRQDVAGMRRLVETLQSTDEARKQALRTFLAEQLGFEDPDLSQRITLIETQRKAVYKVLIQAFLKHDAEAIAQLHEPLDAYADIYHLLAHQQNFAAAAGGDDDRGNEAHATALRKENRRLKDEVNITLGTLNNIFAEYTSMFGEQIDRAQMSVEEIIAAMEKYSGQPVADTPDESMARHVPTPEGLHEPFIEGEGAAKAELTVAQAPIEEELSRAEAANERVAEDEHMPQAPRESIAALELPSMDSNGDDGLESSRSTGEDETELSRLMFSATQVAALDTPTPDLEDVHSEQVEGVSGESAVELDVDEIDELFRRAKDDAEHKA